MPLASKILVSVITGSSLWAQTASWLVQFIGSDPSQAVDIVESPKGIVHNRNLAAHRFLSMNCTHLFMLDSDCVPQPGTIERLLSHNKDVVAAAAPARINGELGIVAMDEVEDGYVQHHPMEGLQQVNALGGTGVLVRRNVLEAIPPPWYQERYGEDGLLAEGEDFMFSRLLRMHGYELWVDFDLALTHKAVR